MKFAAVCLGALAVAVLAGQVYAQPANPVNVERYQRQLDEIQRQTALLANPNIPAGERALLDYGGFITASYLSVDDPSANNHTLREYDLVGYARLNLDDVQEFYARGRISWEDFSPGDSFDGNGDQVHARIDRAYYRFDLQKALAAYQGKQVDYDASIMGGRQLVYWANGLVLVQTLDGAMVNLSYKTTNLQILAAVTPADTIDIDTSRPGFDNNTHRGFYGAMLSKTIGEHRPYIYFLSQQDYNHSDPRTIGSVVTRFDYDSYYIGVGSAGTIGDRVSYGLEGVYEGGHGLSNSFSTAGGALSQVPQTEEEINAFAVDLRIDYLFNDPNRSRLTFEGIVASGDNDRRQSSNTFGGNQSGTDDLGFNAFGQVANGLAFGPTISNLYIFRAGGSTFPSLSGTFRELNTGLDLYFFGKWSDRAPIDEPTDIKGYLGCEPDIFANWQVTSDVTLALRYGVFLPSPALINHSARQFLYGGLTFAF